MALNSVTNAITYNTALGAQQRQFNLGHRQSVESGQFSFQEGVHGGAVSVVNESIVIHTLDQYKLQKIKLVKVDVEGGELDVLLGGINTIRALNPILYLEFNDQSTNERKTTLIQFLQQTLMYTAYQHTFPTKIMPGYNESNILCFPRTMSARLKEQAFATMQLFNISYQVVL